MKNRIEIKICGLTNRDDAQAAVDLGADYLGFVLHTKSPRAISTKEMVRIVDQIGGGVRAVGVFVNETRLNVENIARDGGLYAVQIHGDEAAGDFEDFPLTVWRAVWLRDGQVQPDPELWDADRLVLDTGIPGQYGGTGVTSDWDLAAQVAGKRRAMLAGGLTPENVADAIRAVQPRGVDVSGGVESEPGRKDPEKMKRFIEAARGALLPPVSGE